MASRQALPARPPPPQGPSGPPAVGSWVRPSSTGPGDGHACRHYARRPSGAFRIGPSKVQNARVAHEGPCGGARGIAVGSTEWGRRVCSSVFYGGTGASASGSGAAGSAAMSGGSQPAAAPSDGDRREQGHLTNRPRRARVFYLRPMTRIQRGTLVQRHSREGAPPPTPGRRCSGTSRARCGGTAY